MYKTKQITQSLSSRFLTTHFEIYSSSAFL